MADITAAMVKDLREKSGAGMMDCKKALNETSGDMDAALDLQGATVENHHRARRLRARMAWPMLAS